MDYQVTNPPVPAGANRVASMMGHGSKKTVYEVYGEYVEGLQEDRQKILQFFGEDFLPLEMQKAA